MKIVIAEPADKNDLGFINWVVSHNIDNLADRIRPKDDAEKAIYLKYILSFKPKIVKVDNRIICAFWLSDVEEDLTAIIHLHFNTYQDNGRKNYYLFKKNNIGDCILDDVFKNNNINSVLCLPPEWITDKSRVITTILTTAGFKFIGIMRDMEKYFGKRQSYSVYQVCRGFFYKWKSMEKAFKKGFSIEDIAKNYKVECAIIKKVANLKKWGQ